MVSSSDSDSSDSYDLALESVIRHPSRGESDSEVDNGELPRVNNLQRQPHTCEILAGPSLDSLSSPVPDEPHVPLRHNLDQPALIPDYVTLRLPDGTSACWLLLAPHREVHVCGRAIINVYSGIIQVNGVQIWSSSPSLCIFSQTGTGGTTEVRAVEGQYHQEPEKPPLLWWWNSDIQRIIPEPPVAWINQRGSAIALLREDLLAHELEPYDGALPTLPLLIRTLVLAPGPGFRLWPGWNEIIGPKANHATARIAVIGSRRCGKSTLVRSILNLIANTRDDAVLVVCDVDDNAFKFPGLVSVLEMVRTHGDLAQLRPAATSGHLFVGDIDYQGDTSHMTQSLVRLAERGRLLSELRQCPVVLDSYGWTTRLGRRVLGEILVAFEPTVILDLSPTLPVPLPDKPWALDRHHLGAAWREDAPPPPVARAGTKTWHLGPMCRRMPLRNYRVRLSRVICVVDDIILRRVDQILALTGQAVVLEEKTGWYLGVGFVHSVDVWNGSLILSCVFDHDDLKHRASRLRSWSSVRLEFAVDHRPAVPSSDSVVAGYPAVQTMSSRNWLPMRGAT